MSKIIGQIIFDFSEQRIVFQGHQNRRHHRHHHFSCLPVSRLEFQEARESQGDREFRSENRGFGQRRHTINVITNKSQLYKRKNSLRLILLI